MSTQGSALCRIAVKYLDPSQLFVLLTLASLLFGPKRPHEIADDVAEALLRFHRRSGRTLPPTSVRDLTVFGLICLALFLLLNWLALRS